MLRTEKERLVEELAERLRSAESLIVADYRGLTNAELAALRTRLREHGARLTVVKNTLTRRAAEAAGADIVLALLEGPTAIAFVEASGDPAAVAKALADTAKETKILSLRGGVLSGKPMAAADVEELAKLPAVDVLKSQLVGVIVAPLTQLVGLLSAPLRDLVGLIDARIGQLEESGAASEQPSPPDLPETEAASAEPAVEAGVEEPAGTDADEAPEAEAETDGGAAETPAPEAQEPDAEQPVAEAGDEDAADETADDQTDQTKEEQE